MWNAGIYRIECRKNEKIACRTCAVGPFGTVPLACPARRCRSKDGKLRPKGRNSEKKTDFAKK